MTGELSTALLIVVLVVTLTNLLIGVLVWQRHDGLAHRVTKIEAAQQHALSARETREIHERLASIEGQMSATNQVMRTIQEYLLEQDP
ncbi:MAG: hypothetical protein ACOY5V_00210 [Pseudomonadota bacterium]